MLRAYFDDSSDPKRETFMVCGGAFGTSRSWDKAEIAWALRTESLERPFRSTDCECQQREFSKWDKPSCDKLITDLISILLRFEIGSYAAIVSVPDFRSVFPDAGEYDPYYLAFTDMVVSMAVLAEVTNGLLRQVTKQTGLSFPDEKVLLWFEENEPVDVRCNQIYHQLKSSETWPERDRLAGRTFADKGCIPLQAADLMAREAFKFACNQGQRVVRKPVLRMKQQITYHRWDRALLQRLKDHGGLENLTQVLGISREFGYSMDAVPIQAGNY